MATSTLVKANAPAGRDRRSTRSILTTLAFLLLTPIIGIGATLGILYANGQFSASTAPQTSVSVSLPTTPTPGPATQATMAPPAAFQQSRDTDLNLSYQYPKDWKADPARKTTGYTVITLHSPTAYNITMYLVHFAASTTASYNTNNDVNQADIQNLTSQGVVVQQAQADKTQKQIGGQTWDELDGSFVDPNTNSAMRLISITGKHTNEYYHVLIFLPELYYTTALQEYFTPMLNDIKFIA